MVIIADNVSKQYGKRSVLRSIQFRLPEGQWCSIVGASGSGKSTLLKITSGLLDPDSGDISVRSSSDPQRRRESIAYMMQDFPLYPSLTVAENIQFAVSRQYSADGPPLDQIIQELRIQNVLEQLPSKLSGGERQRAALARTLLLHRPVLLLDEPLSNVDVVLRRSIRRYLKSLHRQWGYTTILVTHDQEDAISTSELVAVLSDGSLLQWGTPSDVFARPASDTVANAFGDVQMSWFPVSLLPESQRANMIIPANCSVIGVRETAFRWSAAPQPDFWESEVYDREYLGSRIRLLITMHNYKFSLVVSNHPAVIPEKLWIQPDLTLASYYDSIPISDGHDAYRAISS